VLSALLLAALVLTAGCADLPVPGRATGTVPAVSAAVTVPPPSATPTVRRAPATETIAPVPTPDPEPTRPPSATATASPRPTADPTATPVPPTTTRAPVASPSGPQRMGDLVLRGDPGFGVVALTFDAGTTAAGNTTQVLDTLKSYGAHSTFFLTGEWAVANPALVRRMRDDGHELANHTYDHPNLTEISDQVIRTQIARTEAAVSGITGRELVRLIRPPFGAYDRRVLGAVGSAGYTMIYWSLDSGDWIAEVSAEQVVQTVGTRAVAGDIVVFHCYAPKTAQALPGVMKRLSERGLRFGTVGSIIAGGHAPAPAPAPGTGTVRPTTPTLTHAPAPSPNASTPTAETIRRTN
jgi:peptidoglycan/xylan/chitin deacetylase (PgdA/CDA1 family)